MSEAGLVSSAACAAAATGPSPAASAAYREHLARVLTARALAEAASRN